MGSRVGNGVISGSSGGLGRDKMRQIGLYILDLIPSSAKIYCVAIAVCMLSMSASVAHAKDAGGQEIIARYTESMAQIQNISFREVVRTDEIHVGAKIEVREMMFRVSFSRKEGKSRNTLDKMTKAPSCVGLSFLWCARQGALTGE